MDQRRDTYARLITLIYALAVILTLAVVFFIGLQFTGPVHLWISLAALLIAETAVYGLNLYHIGNRNRPDGIVSGYLAYMTIAGLYLLAAAIAIVISLIFPLSAARYGLIHVILLAAAGILAGFVAIFSRNASDQEQEMKEQVWWVQQMGIALLGIKQDLETWNHQEKERIKKGIEDLEEKVRYSDPVSQPEVASTEMYLLDQARSLASGVRGLANAPDAAAEAERIGAQIRDMANQIAVRNRQLLQAKS